MRISVWLSGCMALVMAAGLQAKDLDNIGDLGQQEFRELSEDLGAMVSYKGLQPPAPLGLIGFNVGVDITHTLVENSDAWETATGGNNVDSITMARIRASKGLPWGVDVGASYTRAPESDIEVTGIEGRYAILEGSPVSPSLGVRAAYTRLSGVDELSLDTRSLDISVGQQMANLTPYAGLGRVWVRSRSDAPGIEREEFSDTKLFVGAQMRFLVGRLALEVDQTGDATSLNAMFSIGLGG